MILLLTLREPAVCSWGLNVQLIRGSPAADQRDEKHGDCLVSQGKGHLTSQGKNLGIWVEKQRADYKNGKLTAEQIARLDKLGFVWKTKR